MKNTVFVVSLVLLLCFAFGCQNKAEKAELEKFRIQAKVEEQNKALVAGIFDGLNKRNEAIYQDSYAPEYGWHFPATNPKAMSREEEAGFVKLLWVGFPDMHWDVKEILASGDRVIVRFTASGTHTGEYQGMPPTGNKFESGGIWLGQVKDGKILEGLEEFDALGWMQQLGMELKPKEVEKK
jgi:ketosteroid isomerase-like protein